MKELLRWLVDNSAVVIRHEELSYGDELDWINVHGRVFVLQKYVNGNGWQIFVPPTDSNSIAATLRALDERLSARLLHPATRKGAYEPNEYLATVINDVCGKVCKGQLTDAQGLAKIAQALLNRDAAIAEAEDRS